MKFLRLADLSSDRLIRYARFPGAVLLLVVGQPAYAISYGGPTFSGLVQNTLLPMGNQAVAVLVAVAVAIFFVGMVRYIFSAGDERSKEYGRSLMVWGVMAPSAKVEASGLEGSYGGATASAAVGVGVGANALVGGSDNHIMLQPLSIEGQTGLNVAAGVVALELKAAK